MDEGGDILIDGLAKVGIIMPFGVSTQHDVESASLVSICSQSLRLLSHGGAAFATSLPDSMPDKFRLCTDLANAIRQLGYLPELSFHQFLYPSEGDIGQILRFLLERLSQSKSSASARAHGQAVDTAPETSNHSSSSKTDKDSAVNEDFKEPEWDESTEVINECFNDLLQTNGVESHFATKPLVVSESSDEMDSLEAEKVSEGAYPEVSLQSLHISSSPVVEGEKSIDEDPEMSHHLRKDCGIDIDELASLAMQASQMEAVLAEMRSKEEILRRKFDAKKQETKLLKGESLILKEAVGLVLDKQCLENDYLVEISERVEGRKKNLADLESQWASEKRRLEERKGGLENLLKMNKHEMQEHVEKMKNVQQEIELTNAKILEREAEEAALSLQLTNNVKPATRNSYLERIRDLIKNSKKQDTDLTRIINENHELQREHNSTEERLHRTYALVDEIVFRDAKMDPVRRQIYRTLTSIHQNFSETVENIFNIAKMQGETTEYEAKLEALQKKRLDISKLQHDLDSLWKENELLEKQLQK